MNLKYLFSMVLGALISALCFSLLNDTNVNNPIKQTPKVEAPSVQVQTDTPSHNANFQSPTPADNLPTLDSDLKAEVDRLNSLVSSLRLQLEFLKSANKSLLSAKSFEEKIISTKMQIESKMPDSEWSDSDIENSYLAPFDQIIKRSKGLAREKYHAFQYEPIDQEWASTLETKIRDFFTLNEFGYLVEIKMLNCKTFRCQIGVLVSEPEGKPWKRIFDQMTLEPWFVFHTYSSSPIVDRDYKVIGNFFFLEGFPQIQDEDNDNVTE